MSMVVPIGCLAASASARTPPSASPSTTIVATSLSAPTNEPVNTSALHGCLAFSKDDGIWVSAADGSHARQLTRDGGFDPTWSADGKVIAYRRLTGADDGEIWTVDVDDGTTVDLVNDPDHADWGPAWSPDGSHIAYSSDRDGPLAIWTMKADGSDQRPLIDQHGEYPTWSPDGKQLAYAGGDYDIFVVNADGTDPHPILTTPGYDMGPAWSPDGRWIAFHTQSDAATVAERGMGNEMEIHLVSPDGRTQVRVTSDSVEDSFAAWSPDSQYLIWSRHGDLVIARPDGRGMVRIEQGSFPAWQQNRPAACA